jgi:uncharacterized iron-regulated protein
MTFRSCHNPYLYPPALIAATIIAVLLTGGCAVPQKTLQIPAAEKGFAEGAIIATDTAEAISFESLIDRLAEVAVVYVGERHTSQEHHDIQLRILTALAASGARVKVGMEMFDHTYQPVLDQWTAGELDEQRFLERTHWYANWRFDYGLYRPILAYVQQESLPLVGLNLPFHLPPKISTGGLESLRPHERALIAADIDTGDSEHRAYLEGVFKQHRLKGRDNFAYFYAAQCAWEDTMARQVAANLGGEALMLVIIGNGHIVKKYGVPKRAEKRSQRPYRTVYLAPAGGEADRSDADFIWVTAPAPPSPHMGKMRP